MEIARVHMLTTRNVATGIHTRTREPLISLTFMLKMLVTKDSGTYRKASLVIICPCCACSLIDPASMTLIELIRRVKESIENFSSTLACSKTSCKAESGYLMYFE